jgi:hypothetical protein
VEVDLILGLSTTTKLASAALPIESAIHGPSSFEGKAKAGELGHKTGDGLCTEPPAVIRVTREYKQHDPPERVTHER